MAVDYLLGEDLHTVAKEAVFGMVVQVAVLRPSSDPFRLAAAAVEGLDVARLAAGCSAVMEGFFFGFL